MTDLPVPLDPRRSGPLTGVRIVEFDAIGPVPLAAMILADMGAEVVRLARRSGAAWSEVGGAVLNRGRPHVSVDLKSPEDRDAILDLIDCADALLEGFRPGVMERLGLGPDVCLARNPRLAYARMNGITYNRLIQGLNLAGVEVDRRILADLAVTEPATFAAIVATAKAALPADTSAPKVDAA